MSKFPKTGEILVRLPNWVGDAVMASPVLANLARSYRRIYLQARPALLKLFQGFPRVAGLFPVEKGRGGLRAGVAAIKGRFSAGLLLPNSFSSALVFFLGRVKARAGYAADGRRLLLTHPVRRPRGKLHQVDYYLYLLEALGLEVTERDLLLPLPEYACQRAAALLADLPRPRVGLAPGAAFGPAKRWPVARYRALAYHLRREGFSIVVLGGVSERQAGQEIAAELPRSRSLCGLTDLPTAAAVIAQLDLFVSNDSGLMHVAAALKCPQVALFGSTDPEVTGPRNPRAEVLYAGLPCSPCMSRTCKHQYACFEALRVADVFEACMRAIS